MPLPSRRKFLATSAAAAAAMATRSTRAEPQGVLGHGEFKYRVVKDWGVLDAETPVKNCHGLVCDNEGHIFLFNDHIKNNVIVYDKKGKLVHKWGTQFPGAHGLSIVTEGDKEILFMTDLNTHKVYKATLDGKILNEWGWPEPTGKYAKEADYKPSWTLHLADGSFFVLDGYGKDYITHYGADGKFIKMFGGPEGGIVHWGPHGGMADLRDPKDPTLLIAMSDQQYLLRLSLDGKKLAQIDIPGGNPRQIRLNKDHFYMAHLGDNWPKDKDCRGFVSVLDKDLKVVSNPGGTAPEYGDDGKLKPMKHQEEIFMHPHDLIVDDEGSIYVGQFASKNTYPIKLERV